MTYLFDCTVYLWENMSWGNMIRQMWHLKQIFQIYVRLFWHLGVSTLPKNIQVQISRVIFAEKYSGPNLPRAEKILAAKARHYEFSSNFPGRQMCPRQIWQSTFKIDRAERHDFRPRLWLFFSTFLFPPNKRRKKKRRMN